MPLPDLKKRKTLVVQCCIAVILTLAALGYFLLSDFPAPLPGQDITTIKPSSAAYRP